MMKLKATLKWLWLAYGIMALEQSAAALEEGQRFTDWTVGCEKPPGTDSKRCFIHQTLIDKNDKPVLQMAVGYFIDDKKPAAIVAVPLGVVLAPGVGLRVDGGDVVRFPYERCVAGPPLGCIAGLPLNADMIGRFKRGSKAEVIFHDGKRLVPVPISLKGFTKGFDALQP